MNKLKFVYITLLSFCFLSVANKTEWGFFAHKKINRLAVFTLPSEMILFYKNNIDYLTAASVNPDKRRHSVIGEDIKHYIDIDVWDTAPFKEVPREFDQAIAKYSELHIIVGDDTVIHKTDEVLLNESMAFGSEIIIDAFPFKYWVKRQLMYPNKEYTYAVPDSLFILTPSNSSVYLVDNFSEYGILPYNLEHMYGLLVYHMKQGNAKKILRYSAEIGHYLSDAHVPLHTTVNYNGQLTNQEGIHALWESRLPEMFADMDYDFFVGKAKYKKDINQFLWNIILKSHKKVNKVLSKDLEVQASLKEDEIYSFKERNGNVIRTPSDTYITAYHNAMNGMVEKQMQLAIVNIGSIWYSAWIDAGKPDLSVLSLEETEEEEKKTEDSSKLKHRQHK